MSDLRQIDHGNDAETALKEFSSVGVATENLDTFNDSRVRLLTAMGSFVRAKLGDDTSAEHGLTVLNSQLVVEFLRQPGLDREDLLTVVEIFPADLAIARALIDEEHIEVAMLYADKCFAEDMQTEMLLYIFKMGKQAKLTQMDWCGAWMTPQTLQEFLDQDTDYVFKLLLATDEEEILRDPASRAAILSAVGPRMPESSAARVLETVHYTQGLNSDEFLLLLQSTAKLEKVLGLIAQCDGLDERVARILVARQEEYYLRTFPDSFTRAALSAAGIETSEDEDGNIDTDAT